ncbi:hypothetical protein ACFV0O_03865 [Kitasatospora sp. NPDC059577]|uniref:hypothetical protein n=1 Tax=Kitasatospora sp. NPDC059577 TaxID=3346873 RepID=UPI0036BEA916
MAWYQGASRITVTAVEGRVPHRAVVAVAGAGPVEIPGEVGAVHLVQAERRQLDLEHRHAGEWCPTIRAVQGRCQEIRGVLTQAVHNRNRDVAGDRQDRNLVLRIEWVAPDGDEPAPATATPAAPHHRRAPGPGGLDRVGRAAHLGRPGVRNHRSRRAARPPLPARGRSLPARGRPPRAPSLTSCGRPPRRAGPPAREVPPGRPPRPPRGAADGYSAGKQRASRACTSST